MKSVQPDQAGNLGFLQPYKVDGELFSLSSGASVLIQKYCLTLFRGKVHPYQTPTMEKLSSTGTASLFAELAVLRLFQSHGWEGVWSIRIAGNIASDYLMSQGQ